jgi:peptidoglycan-associated lipoprotein
MTRRISETLAVLFLALAIALSGCAMTQSGSSADSGPGGDTMRASGRGDSVRPSPRDFVAVADLADVHFDFDRYDIRPDDAKILEGTARWLKDNPSVRLLIEGHADERGTNEYNLTLGDRRARASMNYLVSYGVAANRITMISYGEERPICRQHTENCWAENRRAHFAVKMR